MNARMTRLQHEGDKLRAASPSLTRQHLQQPSGGDLSTAKVNATATITAGVPSSINTTPTKSMQQETTYETTDVAKSSADHGTISATMEEMLKKYNDLDEESKKAQMHHAILSNNEGYNDV